MRRKNIGRRTRNAMRVYNIRNNETVEEHRQRLEANRMRISQARSTTATKNPYRRLRNIRSNVSITYERLEFRCDVRVDYSGDKSVDFRTMNKIFNIAAF